MMKAHLLGEQYAFKIEVYRNNTLFGTYYDWWNGLAMEANLNDVIKFNVYRNIGTLENPVWNSNYYTEQRTVGTDYSVYSAYSPSIWAHDVPDVENS